MPLSDLRDWAIVIAAILMIVQTILWIVLLVVLIRVVSRLNREVQPVMQSARATAANVRATADIVSETVVQPFIRMAAMFAGVRRALAILSGLRRRGRDT